MIRSLRGDDPSYQVFEFPLDDETPHVYHVHVWDDSQGHWSRVYDTDELSKVTTSPPLMGEHLE